MSIIGPVFVMNPFSERPIAAVDNSGGNPHVVEPLRRQAVELDSIEDVLNLVGAVNKKRDEAEWMTRRAESALHAVRMEAHSIIDQLVDSHRSREFYYGLLAGAERRALDEYGRCKGGEA